MRTDVASVAVPGACVGMQGPPDGGVDLGEAFDAGSETVCAEIADRESHRAEIESLLRRGEPRSDGRFIDVGRRRARRTKKRTVALHRHTARFAARTAGAILRTGRMRDAGDQRASGYSEGSEGRWGEARGGVALHHSFRWRFAPT